MYILRWFTFIDDVIRLWAYRSDQIVVLKVVEANESLGKKCIFATFCENALSQPPIVGKFFYKRSVSLYLCWLSLSVRNKFLVKWIILPKLSKISSTLKLLSHKCFHARKSSFNMVFYDKNRKWTFFKWWIMIASVRPLPNMLEYRKGGPTKSAISLDSL